jgi:hypothetical protein
MIGATGTGKSSFGKALTEGQAPFLIGQRATAGTVNTTEFACDISPKWVPWPWSRRPDPRCFYWYFVDTPGLEDSKGAEADIEYMHEMIESLKASPIPINVLALVVQFSPPRFSQTLQHTLKVFDSIFNEPKSWDQVCFIVTHTPHNATNEEREAWTKTIGNDKCVRDQLIDLLHRLWTWEGEDPEFPVFFVDSRDPHGSSESEFERFIDFACSRGTVRLDASKMKHYDPKVMRQLPVTKTITCEERQSRGLVSRGKRLVPREFIEECTVEKEEERDRKADFWDVITFGLGWLFRERRTKVQITKKTVKKVIRNVEEDIFKGEVLIITFEQEQQAMITFDYNADTITTDDLETPVRGRTIGAWNEINKKAIATRVEYVD